MNEKKINQALKGLKSVDYDIDELENGEHLTGNFKAVFKVFKNLDEISEIRAILRAKEVTEELIEKIRFESTIDKIL